MKKILLLTFVAVLALVSCKKDNFEKFEPTSGGFVEKQVTASFEGIIVDASTQGLEGVAVSIGTNQTTTDENGVFFFKDISVQNTKAYFSAKKTGYFLGTRTVIAKEGSTHQVRIKMLDNSPIGSFPNNSGGEITVPEGGKLTFEAGDVAYPNGDVYTGQVNVAAKRIDPTTDNGQYEMPGDLRGINADGKNVSLSSFGMMAVELTDNSGNLLQVAPNQTVDIDFAVPASLVANAPTEIPLWYFDEDNGEWKEDGTATLSGNTYSGKVGHFSYWNCDYYGDRVYFEATFVDESGNPFPNVWIHVGLNNSGAGGHGTTDNNGWVGGQIPGNSNVGLYYTISGGCNTVFLMSFTTTNVDVNLGTLTLENVSVKNYTINGTLVDCSDMAVSNGYIRSTSNDWAFAFVQKVNADGTFSKSITSCALAPSILVTGYDIDNLVQSSDYSYDLSTISDLGNIKACDIFFDEFLTINSVSNLTGNDTTVTLIPPVGFYVQVDSLSNTFQSWNIYSSGQQDYYNIKALTEGVGTYPGVGNYDTNYGGGEFSCSLNVTSYPTASGEYIEGTIDSDGSSPVVTGSFRIKKQ